MNIFKILLTLTFLFYQGCSTQSQYKEKILKKELIPKAAIPKKQKKPAVTTIEVNAENFHIVDNKLPDKEIIKKAKIMGAKLNDVINLLTEATDEDIIFQTQRTSSGDDDDDDDSGSDNSNERDAKVFLSASNVGFGRLLQKSIGDKLSIRYEDETFYLGYTRTVTVKIPSLKGLASVLKNELQTMGATDVVYNAISSSVTFTAREKEYKEIMEYLKLLRNSLYVIEYDIAIYDVQLSDDYALGIDWSVIPTISKKIELSAETVSSLGSVATKNVPSTIGTLFDLGNYNVETLVSTLESFGKVESIQKPKLLGVAGTDVTLVDGLEEPYISQLKTTSVGDSGIQTSTQSASALSGLRVTLNSNIMDETILTNISLEINDVIGYNSFKVGDNTYSQPKTVTKSIKNEMRVQPGVPIVISGLFRHESDKGYKGLPGLSNTKARLLAGSEYEGVSKSEMVIIVTPRVIKYVVK